MHKKEFVAAVAEKLGATKKASAEAIDAVLEVITETVAAGEKVTLIGFGEFGQKTRKERSAYDFQTKQTTTVPAKQVPYFKAGSKLKEAVK